MAKRKTVFKKKKKKEKRNGTKLYLRKRSLSCELTLINECNACPPLRRKKKRKKEKKKKKVEERNPNVLT